MPLIEYLITQYNKKNNNRFPELLSRKLRPLVEKGNIVTYLEKINEKNVYNFFMEVYETFEEKKINSYGDEMSSAILLMVKYYNNNDFTRLFDIAQDYINNWLELSLQDIKDIFENYGDYARKTLQNIHKERGYYIDSEDFYHHNILSAICAEYKRLK